MNGDPGVKMECTCGACPEQYEGTVDGNPAYFRLRHSWWRFCIIEPGGNPIGPGLTPDKKVLYYKEGEHEPGQDAGIMENAQGLIAAMVAEFRRHGKEGRVDSFLRFLESYCPGDDGHDGLGDPRPLLERCSMCATIHEAHRKAVVEAYNKARGQKQECPCGAELTPEGHACGYWPGLSGGRPG